jgi:hypothetical protein
VKDLCEHVRRFASPGKHVDSQDAQRPSLESSSNNTHVSNSQGSPHRLREQRTKLLQAERQLIDARSLLFQASEGAIPSTNLLYLQHREPSAIEQDILGSMMQNKGEGQLATMAHTLLREMAQLDKLRGEARVAQQVLTCLQTSSSHEATPDLLHSVFQARTACLQSLCTNDTNHSRDLLVPLAAYMQSLAGATQASLSKQQLLQASFPYRLVHGIA